MLPMKMKFTKIYVNNQDKALTFYTEVLGFLKKADFLVGSFRWLTVVSPEEPDGTELLLEPNDNPASKISQSALFQQGIPATAFAVSDIQHEYERLKQLGVVWTQEPIQMGSVIIAIFDDTCGNFIQLVQV
ncbi:hypothetical protein KSF_006230 [Reticulibacter mediterranei]|uniref:VOC domain-containing protein n=2 Tax=Reticulibacter mediterranei TaxID=2778369 RepID=A0A8J3IDQ7_9CHLR|nr:VOC family protein [Reticulibacter mediterranei]GHO90575.1 hypothetical protein KSF_006230 [Reticulibacter mediterranei]